MLDIYLSCVKQIGSSGASYQQPWVRGDYGLLDSLIGQLRWIIATLLRSLDLSASLSLRRLRTATALVRRRLVCTLHIPRISHHHELVSMHEANILQLVFLALFVDWLWERIIEIRA